MVSVSRLAMAFAMCTLISNVSFSQQCNCGSEFSFVRSYIERNYPGFADKTPEYYGVNYRQFTDEYQAKADSEKNTVYCMMFVKEWLRYFKDNHLQIVSNPLIGNDSDILAERIRNAEIVEVSPEKIKEIKKSKGVEGVYYEYDSVYKVAVVKSPNSWRTYAAVILESRNRNWKPGMVKFELKEKNDSTIFDGKKLTYYPCIFHMGNLGVYPNKHMSFSGYGLDGGIWKKEGLKESAQEQAARNKKAKEHENAPKKSWSYLEFNKPNQQCAYLRVSNFDVKVADVIDSFVKDHDSVISNTPDLIIDLRGNSGGSDRSYEALLPYIYTNPIVSVGMVTLSTRDNIDAEKAALATVEQEDVKRWLTRRIEEMEGNYGHYTTLQNDTLRMDSVKKYPEKIAILVDHDCASSTEQFLLTAQQSTKVMILGQATNGTLDYSNWRSKKFPCIPYTLQYPITRSGRLPQHPIDNIGIKPNVELKTDGTDWVKEAVRYLEGKK